MLIMTGRPPADLSDFPVDIIKASSTQEEKVRFCREVIKQCNAYPFIILDMADEASGILTIHILQNRLDLPQVSSERLVKRIDNQPRPKNEGVHKGCLYLVVPYLNEVSRTEDQSIKNVVLADWDADRLSIEWVLVPPDSEE